MKKAILLLGMFPFIALNAQTYKYTIGSTTSEIPESSTERTLENGKKVTFTITGVNPFVYNAEIKGTQVDFEIDVNVDSLLKFTSFIFPELAPLVKTFTKMDQSDEKSEGLIADYTKKDNEGEKIADQIKSDYEELKVIFDFFKNMGYANLKLVQLCEFAKTKEELVSQKDALLTRLFGEKDPAKIELTFLDKQRKAKDLIEKIYNNLKKLKKINDELDDTEELSKANYLLNSQAMEITGTDKKGNNTPTKSAKARNVDSHNYDDYIEEVDDNLEKANEGLDSNYNVLFLNLNGILQNIEISKYEFTSSPVFVDSDEIEVEYKLIPKQNLLYRKIDIAGSTTTTNFWVKKRWKTFISAGLALNNFKEYNYSEVEGDKINDTTWALKPGVGFTDSLTAINEIQQFSLKRDMSATNVGFVVLANSTYRFCYRFSLGGHIGTMVDLNKHLKFVTGLTFSFGAEKRLNLNVGACFGNYKELKEGYELGKAYGTSLGDNLPLKNKFDVKKTNLCFALTYNLNFKRKKRETPKEEPTKESN